jgi:hypothetical protein
MNLATTKSRKAYHIVQENEVFTPYDPKNRFV